MKRIKREHLHRFLGELQVLHDTCSLQEIEIKCCGGSWYIDSEDMYDIYEDNLEYGLKPLAFNTDLDSIGESFADQVILRNQLYQLEMKFNLHLN